MNTRKTKADKSNGVNAGVVEVVTEFTRCRHCMECCCTAIMRGGYHGGGQSHGRPITKQLEVPNEMIGTIIGRHGMKINEIR